MIKNIIFDLDGTLIDSASSIVASLEQSLFVNKVEPLCHLDSSLIGPPLDVTLKKITGLSDIVLLNQIIESFKAIYDEEGYKLAIPYDGVDEMFTDLIELGFDLHLVTNKRMAPTQKIIDYFNWANNFYSIYTPDSLPGFKKNKAESISLALTEHNLNQSQTVYIGDIKADCDAALANKIQFIFASWGYGRQSEHNYLNIVNHANDIKTKVLSIK